MFCSSKLIFMPAGVSFMHSPYSYGDVSLLLAIEECAGHAFMMRFLAPVLIVAAVGLCLGLLG